LAPTFNRRRINRFRRKPQVGAENGFFDMEMRSPFLPCLRDAPRTERGMMNEERQKETQIRFSVHPSSFHHSSFIIYFPHLLHFAVHPSSFTAVHSFL
jgi:hypothetical protein